MREMSQHYQLPIVGSAMSFRGGKPVSDVRISLELKVGDLQKYDGWNSAARKFLKAAGETIDLLGLVDRYYEHVCGFNDWLREEQFRIHGGVPDAYRHLVLHGGRLKRPEVGLFASRLREACAKAVEGLTYNDLQHAFDPVLTVLDERRLMLCRHDPMLWLETALTAAGTRFSVPAEAEAMVSDLVASLAEGKAGADR